MLKRRSNDDRGQGMWYDRDGKTIWVADSRDNKIYAYNTTDGTRNRAKEYELVSDWFVRN